MAKYQGKDAWVLAAGYNLTQFALDVKYERGAAMEDSHTLGDSWREQEPVNIKSANVDLNAFYDDSAHAVTVGSGSALALNNIAGSEQVICLGFEGQTAGKRFIGGKGLETRVAVQAARGALHKIAGPITMTGVIDEDGVILHPLGAFASTSGNDTGVDNGAQTTAGGVAYLQVISNTGNFVGKVQDSANNSTFADIATFATVPTISATPAAERKEIAGTIRQYTRCLWTNSTGPAYGFMGLKRN